MPVPKDFKNRNLEIEFVDASELIRIFRPAPGKHPKPIFYGSSGSNRFDTPPYAKGKQRYKIAYAAFDLITCFAETITREDNRRPLQFGGIVVSESGKVHPRHVARLNANTRLRLANVTDLGLYGLGAEAGEFHSADYPNDTQPWALELFKRSESVDGLLYRSRFLNGRLAVAIYERGGLRVGLGAAHVGSLVKHPDYPKALKELNIYLLP